MQFGKAAPIFAHASQHKHSCPGQGQQALSQAHQPVVGEKALCAGSDFDCVLVPCVPTESLSLSCALPHWLEGLAITVTKLLPTLSLGGLGPSKVRRTLEPQTFCQPGHKWHHCLRSPQLMWPTPPSKDTPPCSHCYHLVPTTACLSYRALPLDLLTCPPCFWAPSSSHAVLLKHKCDHGIFLFKSSQVPLSSEAKPVFPCVQPRRPCRIRPLNSYLTHSALATFSLLFFRHASAPGPLHLPLCLPYSSSAYSQVPLPILWSFLKVSISEELSLVFLSKVSVTTSHSHFLPLLCSVPSPYRNLAYEPLYLICLLSVSHGAPQGQGVSFFSHCCILSA